MVDVIAAILPRMTARSIRWPGAAQPDHYAIAAQIAATLNIPMRHKPIEIPDFAAALTARGRTGFFVHHISMLRRTSRTGVRRETNLVEAITGHKPAPQLVNANRAKFDQDGRWHCGRSW
ncbi:hypothetical protein [Mycolicibacterium mucogenicum]|uniref:Uncharacterized protein n=1 Tax=Mycolicibacterium mucogenicum DSM 44124 TaxID=1226753 RepID=A0A8H2JC58_MYCMU|nr:hypothetical protein [Mycolicibacterium mucogenicum]QPG70738.1 hypothetical protein C1S78_007195 [Mycolicibacterium mucogenicum DSM 44124]